MNIYWGDACDLSRFDSCSYDAVLCMGPIYHLKEGKDRSKVIELLKQDGIIVCAYINRFASYMLEFMGSEDLLEDRAILEDTLHKGYKEKNYYPSTFLIHKRSRLLCLHRMWKRYLISVQME